MLNFTSENIFIALFIFKMQYKIDVKGIIPIFRGRLTMALEKELKTYHDKLHELKEHEGKFVLIRGEEVIDTYTSYEDAIKEGYVRFRLEPFLVKQIRSIECVQFISRFVPPICNPSSLQTA